MAAHSESVCEKMHDREGWGETGLLVGMIPKVGWGRLLGGWGWT